MIGRASGSQNSKSCVVAGILFCGLILCGATAVQAQDLSVSPVGWDYGSVVAGSSESVTFNLLAGPPTAVWTYVMVLTESQDFYDPLNANPFPWLPGAEPVYSLGAFSFGTITFTDEDDMLPLEMPNGYLITAEVIFTPPSPGYYSLFFGVWSNDSIPPPGPEAFFLLEGTGVAAVVPAPGALLLAGLGTGLAGLMRRRRLL